MARCSHVLAVFCAVFTVTVEAKEAEPISLARADKWEARFDVESCKLLGGFGTGEDRIILRIERFQPGDGFTLQLFGEQFRSNEATSRIKLRFGSNGAMISQNVTNAASSGVPTVVINGWRLDNAQWGPGTTLPAVTAEQEAAVQTLDVLVRGKSYRLELGSMAVPMRTLRRCTDDLYKSLGLDAAEQATLTRPVTPKGNPGTWATSSDYPTRSLRSGETGLIRFRLIVDETGKALACHVTNAMRTRGFEDNTCRLLLDRASFEPALNREGKPVKSVWYSAVRWDIPR